MKKPFLHSSKFKTVLNVLQQIFSKLFFLIVWLLTAICTIATGTDIFIQTVNRADGTAYQFVIVGSYALMALASLTFSFSRFMTVRSAIGDIPKLYIPISQSDVPLRVHNLIQNELTRVNIISLATRPIPAETCRPGWGQPGTALGNTNFKAAVVATLEIVVKNVAKLGKEYEFDRSVSVRIWMEKLVAKGFVDKRIARAYVEGYERARFGYEEIEEKEYLEFMKLITVLVTRLPKA